VNPNPIIRELDAAYREDITAAEARRAHRHRMARMDYDRAMNAIEGTYDAERRAASERYKARLRAASREVGPAPEYRGMPWPPANGDPGSTHTLALTATRNGPKPAIGSGTADPAGLPDPQPGRAA
jgi:hypothetical protein